MSDKKILSLYRFAVVWVIAEIGAFTWGILSTVIPSESLIPRITFGYLFHTVAPVIVAAALLATLIRLKRGKPSRSEEIFYWTAALIQVPAVILTAYFTLINAADAGLFSLQSLSGMLSDANYLIFGVNVFALMIKLALLLFTVFMLVMLQAKNPVFAAAGEVPEAAAEVSPAKTNPLRLTTGVLLLIAHTGYFTFALARFYVVETSAESINTDPTINLIFLSIMTLFMLLWRFIICYPLAKFLFDKDQAK